MQRSGEYLEVIKKVGAATLKNWWQTMAVMPTIKFHEKGLNMIVPLEQYLVCIQVGS
jgi:hypothetical protein